MSAVARGMAHVSYAGGGIFLPARSPYDRQMLVEHIGECVRAKGQVQVLMGRQRWVVQRNWGPGAAPCAECGCFAAGVCSAGANGGGVYCVKCALGSDTEAERPQRAPERRVG
jgi:hypothetical protein